MRTISRSKIVSEIRPAYTRGIAAVLACLTIGCGGGSASSPSAPSAVSPQAVPHASVVMDSYEFQPCTATTRASLCTVAITIRNVGPDCASNVHGILHLTDFQTHALVNEIEFAIPVGTILRPNERYKQIDPRQEQITGLPFAAPNGIFDGSTIAVLCK